ncbi:tetratricopeptide repeat protein [Amycolatopsis sp. CA-230715]|uniref:tetratricopeptide repeat protein n=1 Tax=Amycolatopsis sp. CA-230715 TaxID=2745196 RepID=UPI001C0208C6|nr:tetratricopeptide repeat protein [Amycolatopsis sp. CA-230715]
MESIDETLIRGNATLLQLDSATVVALQAATREFRALDYRHGGGACFDAISVLLRYAETLLRSTTSADTMDQFCVALADLHNLAGWTRFDTGHPDLARRHFERALELAAAAGDDDLVANVCYRLGRVHLHHNELDQAARQFEHGQSIAERAGVPLTQSILSSNQAWVHARGGDGAAAVRLLDTARHQFDLASEHADDRTPPWAGFFDATDLTAMIGTVHTELAVTAGAEQSEVAIPALREAAAGYRDGMARSRSFVLIFLATNHVLDGDVDEAGEVGGRAIDAAGQLTSARARDRIRPLLAAARRLPRDRRAVELSERIQSFLTTPMA